MRIRIAVICALAVIAAACSGSDSSTSTVASINDLADAPETTSSLSEGESAVSADAGLSDADSDDGDSDGDAADEAEEASAEEQVLAFAQCLRDEGLDVDDPTLNADGSVDLRSIFPARGQQGAGADGQAGPPEGFREAFAACGDLIEGLRQARNAEVDQTERNDTLLAFAQCVRDNGYDMPDPDFSAQAGPGGGGPFGDIDRSDPAFIAAVEECQDLLGGLGRGAGGRGPGGGGAGGAGAGGAGAGADRAANG